jgi:hypothetical protein
VDEFVVDHEMYLTLDLYEISLYIAFPPMQGEVDCNLALPLLRLAVPPVE